jgi:hypothetical protein
MRAKTLADLTNNFAPRDPAINTDAWLLPQGTVQLPSDLSASTQYLGAAAVALS